MGKKKAAGGKAAPAAGAAAAKAKAQQSPDADFEGLLDEAEQACSTSGGGNGGAGQALPAWGAGLELEQLEARWGGDPRWQRCPAAQRQAALDRRLGSLRQAARKQQEADYRALLREHGVTAGSRWSRTKDDLSADPRYLALPRDDRCAVRLSRSWNTSLPPAALFDPATTCDCVCRHCCRQGGSVPPVH